MMSAANKPSVLIRQDQLLPTEVSMRSSTWFDRSSSYPIFSAIWYRYRLVSAAISLVLMELIFLMIGFASRAQWRNVAVPAVSMGFGLVFLLTSGIGLAVLVRRQAWPVRKEAIGLVSALLTGLLLSWGSSNAAGYLTKLLVYGDAASALTIELSGQMHEVPKIDPAAAQKAGKKPAPGSAASIAPAVSKAAASDAEEGGQDDHADAKAINTWMTIATWLGVAAFVLRFGGWMDLLVFFRQRRRLEEVLRRQEMDRLKAARNEAELRLSVLVAQVEPHFLFNTLAGVRSAIVTEPQRATAIVDHLVDYLRATIPQMRSDGGSVQARLGPQLEAARAYLALMQARIPRLEYSVDAEPGLQDAAMPPLILISLVENAVKHGIEPKIGPARIDVKARQVSLEGVDSLELSVSDDGVGFGGTTSGSGLGLSNIRERLEALYGNQASLTLKALPTGVSAIILLPLSI
ncbi:sensor histidine kinase [Undibacterium sp. TJN25]|uniref:sensor histidine kinase n=1 Tax=Undibacterium sp. TJN25 TaxID=3413056 RepID=UPI003BF052AB